MSLLWVLVLVTLHLSFFLSTKFVQETVGMKFHSQMSRTIRSSSSGKPLRFLFPVCSKKLEQKPQTLRDKEITVHGSRRTIRRHFSAAFQSVFMHEQLSMNSPWVPHLHPCDTNSGPTIRVNCCTQVLGDPNWTPNCTSATTSASWVDHLSVCVTDAGWQTS